MGQLVHPKIDLHWKHYFQFLFITISTLKFNHLSFITTKSVSDNLRSRRTNITVEERNTSWATEIMSFKGGSSTYLDSGICLETENNVSP